MIRRCVAAACLLLAPATALAVPGPPGRHTLTQPDGTTIHLRYQGGCTEAHAEDDDGFSVVGHSTAVGTWWFYADHDGAQLVPTPYLVGQVDPRSLGLTPHLSGPRRQLPAPPLATSPTRPGLRGLAPIAVPDRMVRPVVFLVRFPSAPPAVDPVSTTREAFGDLLFANGLNPALHGMPASYTQSMRDYFEAASGGAFQITSTSADVYGWIQASQPYSHYVGDYWGVGTYPNEAGGLVHEIAQTLDGTVDFSDYDGDGDGMLDAVILVVQGGSDFSQNLFWPHMNVTPSTLTLDGVGINRYFVISETNGQAGIGVPLGAIHPIGTFAHEFGHLFGLPDLYDTDNTSGGIGGWGLMGSGNYYTPHHPTWPSAWTRIALGWETPIELTGGPTAMQFDAIGAGGQAVRLWVDPLRQSEHYLIENRSSQVEPGLFGDGLLIWHVDQDVIDEGQIWNNVQGDESHPGIKLLQADNARHLQRNINRGDPGDPWPGSSGNVNWSATSTPNAVGYDGVDRGIAITGIPSASLSMNAFVTGAVPDGITLAHDEIPGQAWLSWPGGSRGRVRFEMPADGTITAVRVFSYDGEGSFEVTVRASNAQGLPGTILGDGDTSAGVPGWEDVDVDMPSVTQGQVIWIDLDGSGDALLPVDLFGPISGHSFASGVGFTPTLLDGDIDVRIALSSCADEDGDGWRLCEGDCNDGNPDVNPDAIEICNGIDDDCDGELPVNERDGDGDGTVACNGDCDDTNGNLNPLDVDGDGVTSCDGDCDDFDGDRFPGNPEVCDGVDNDCQGGVPVTEGDGDEDGFALCMGDCDDNDASLTPEDDDEDGYTSCEGDCDDGDPARHPGRTEACNGVDDDCDGTVPADEADMDGDSWRICEGDCDDNNPLKRPLDLDRDGVGGCEGDCNDADETIFPGAPERCNGRDDDCDGSPGLEEGDLDDDGLADCEDGDDDADLVTDDADPAPRDPMICGDSDGDGCDDCAVGGKRAPELDGEDLDRDGICDSSDDDIDGDTIPNQDDPDPTNNKVCGDRDADGCDDCVLTLGPPDPAKDGRDADADGLCDDGGATVAAGCSCDTGGAPALPVLGWLAGVALLRRRRDTKGCM